MRTHLTFWIKFPWRCHWHGEYINTHNTSSKHTESEKNKKWNSNGAAFHLIPQQTSTYCTVHYYIHSLFEVMNGESQLINIDSTKSQTKLICEFLPSAQYKMIHFEERTRSYNRWRNRYCNILYTWYGLFIIGGKMKLRFWNGFFFYLTAKKFL